MAEEKAPEGKVTVRAAKSDMPFLRADTMQLTRVGDVFALTFHQTDYQALADAMNDPGALDAGIPSRVVARVALDADGFHALRGLLDRIYEQMVARKVEP